MNFDKTCRPFDLVYAVVPTVICDISQRGVKLISSDPLKLNDRLHVVLAGLEPLAGTVRWRRADKAGVEFHQFLLLHDLMHWLSQDDRYTTPD